MLSQKVIEGAPVKIILGVLLILEVACIVFSYSVRFDDYIAFVIIVLAVVTAYFGFHYLRNHYWSVKSYQAILAATPPAAAQDETKREVNKLIATPEFKEIMRIAEARRRGDLEAVEAYEKEKQGRITEDSEAVAQ